MRLDIVSGHGETLAPAPRTGPGREPCRKHSKLNAALAAEVCFCSSRGLGRAAEMELEVGARIA